MSAAVLSEGKSLIEHWITSCGKVRGVRVHLDIRCNSHPFKRSTLGHELSLRAQSEDHTVFKVMLVRLTEAASGLLTDDCCPMVILEGHSQAEGENAGILRRSTPSWKVQGERRRFGRQPLRGVPMAWPRGVKNEDPAVAGLGSCSELIIRVVSRGWARCMVKTARRR